MNENKSRLTQFPEAGEVVALHGIKGEVRVMPWCDSVEQFCSFKTLYQSPDGDGALRVIRSRPSKNVAIVELDGFSTPEEARSLRGKTLYVDRRALRLPRGSYLICDLMGMDVRDADNGASYGTIFDVRQTGANDVYLSRTADGKEYIFPAIASVVIETNPEEGFMLIRPLEGLFDED